MKYYIFAAGIAISDRIRAAGRAEAVRSRFH